MWEENPCGMMIRQIHLLLAKMTNNVLRQHDLTMSQTMALLILSKQEDGELTLKQLEPFLQTSQPDVAGIASRLEKKGLVDGFVDAQDKRMKRIRITATGLEYCQQAKGDMIATEQTLLSQMTPDEQKIFRTLLEKAIAGLR